MHKIHEKEFVLDDFSLEHLISYDEGLEDGFLVYTSGDRFSPTTTMCLTMLSLGVAYAANGEPPIGIPWETFQKYSRK